MEYYSLIKNINLISVFSFIISTGFLCIGVYAYAMNRKKLVNNIFLLLCISASVWCLGQALLFSASTPRYAYLFNALSSFGYCTIWSIGIHFLIALSENKIHKAYKIFILINYLISLFFLVAVLSGNSIPIRYDLKSYGWQDVPNKENIVYKIYTFMLIFWMISIISLMIRVYILAKNSKNINQIRRSKIVGFTSIPTAIIALIINQWLPSIPIDFPALGSNITAIFVFGAGYSIIKYKLMTNTLKQAGEEIVKIAGEMILITTLTSTIEECNEEFYLKTGYSKKDIEGLCNLSSVLENNTDVVSLAEFEKKKIKDKEVNLLTKYGEIIHTKLKGSFLYDVDIPIAIVYVLSDINDIKNNEIKLENTVKERTFELSRKIDELKSRDENNKRVIDEMLIVAEGKSEDLKPHLLTITEISVLLCKKYLKEVKIDENDYRYKKYIDEIEYGARFHDIGKIGVSGLILNKQGVLNDEERKEIETHPLIGYSILRIGDDSFLTASAIIAHEHHENYDGTGYPNKVKGEQIAIYSRIVSVADVFDALMRKRSYKESWSKEKIKEFFISERGKKFDPVLVDIFIENFEEFIKIFENNNTII